MTDADAYVAERVRTALAADPRAGELGIAVTVEEGRLVLTGEVATAERRAAVEAVAREQAPGSDIDNRVSALVLGEPGDPETVG
ncbi:MAG TPA: BON domain-containing protein [Acidimicrobiales bacterium]|jgi:osmotically-inducible protein OsmY|nr:BON domain-containing protein [Acidimicrobiales bacterium]